MVRFNLNIRLAASISIISCLRDSRINVAFIIWNSSRVIPKRSQSYSSLLEGKDGFTSSIYIIDSFLERFAKR